MYIFGLSFVSFTQKLSVGKEVFILLFLEHQSKAKMVKILDRQPSKDTSKQTNKKLNKK